MTGFLIVLSVTACNKESHQDSSEPYVKPVDMSLRVLDVMAGAESGVSCTSEDDSLPSSGTTESDGSVSLRVSGNEKFTVQTINGGYMDHSVTGMAGTEDFSVVSLMASRELTEQIYSMLDISADASKGILIVALDDPLLRPAIGARAAVDLNNDGAFVFGSTAVEWSDTVPSGGSGFVAFPNIQTGLAQLTVTAPDGQKCWFSPGGPHSSTAAAEVNITADEVTVALFTCDVEE